MASRLNVDVLVNVKGADQLAGLGGKLQRTGANLTKFVTLPLIGAGVAAFKFSSDANEAMNKAQTVFGDAFGSIAKDAASISDAFSEAQFLDTAGTLGAVAQQMGETRMESADLAKQWLGMAQDFSSFNNLPTEQTLGAIQSALAGEFEPLKRMGIVLNVAKIQAKALALGLIAQGEPLTDNARLIATNALLMESMGAAEGDWARTSDSAANSLKNLAANSVDLGADLGTTLLPIGTQFIGFLQGMVSAFTALPAPVQTGIVALAGVAAVLGPVMLIARQFIGVAGLLHTAILNIPTALGFMDLAFAKAGAAFNALKVLFLANPWILLAAAVIAIAALIILNWDKIWGFLQAVWKKITDAVGALAKALSGAWDTMTAVAQTAWTTLVNIIRGSINGLIDIINGFLGFLNGLSFGAGPWDVGPIHVDAIAIDPFNIPLIPHLAEGGIIRSPTLALLGESGAEAVVPLGKEVASTHFHSHIEVRGEDPFIRNEQDLIRTNQRIAFLEGF